MCVRYRNILILAWGLVQLNLLSGLNSLVLHVFAETELFCSLESVLEGSDVDIFKEGLATLIKGLFHHFFLQWLIGLIFDIFLMSTL